LGHALDTLEAATLAGWTPVHVRLGGAAPAVDWALIEGPFSEPFFEQTAQRAMQHPFNQVFGRTTPLSALEALRRSAQGLAPAGFIFHMSRCGSTLISQMLAQLPATIVLSEAQPLDALLSLRRRAPGLDEETLVSLLRDMISALGRPRAGEERLFVKFRAWHILELPLILRAFPGVPWAFVFREPRAVLRSQESNPGTEVIAGTIDPAYLDLDAALAYQLAPGVYSARVIAALCDAALRAAAFPCASFIDYDTLPEGALALATFFGIRPAAGDVERMRAVARNDAKEPGRLYAARASGEQASPQIERCAAEWLDERYAALKRAAAAR
jgi:hypothetical protein